jgi:hypothetical protein
MLALTSCITDVPVSEHEQPVEITLVAGTDGDGPATRATTPNPGTAADRYINSLRVLGFSTTDGTLAFNNLVFYNKGGKVEGFTGKILVLTGSYALVLIANEHADTSNDSMYKKLEALKPGAATLNDLADLSFPSSKTFDSSKNIPMIARVNDVKISTTGAGDPAPGTTNLNDSGEPLRITMRRLGIRLDLDLKMNAEQIDAWWKSSNGMINIEGVPDRVYLFPRENSTPANRSVWIYPVKSKPDTAGKEGLISVEYPRIILPEILFLPATDKTRALNMSIDSGDKTRRGIIAIDRGATEAGYTIPRNHYLRVTATAKPDYFDITADTSIEGWDDENFIQEM